MCLRCLHKIRPDVHSYNSYNLFGARRIVTPIASHDPESSRRTFNNIKFRGSKELQMVVCLDWENEAPFADDSGSLQGSKLFEYRA
jgi:hypothetical protein